MHTMVEDSIATYVCDVVVNLRISTWSSEIRFLVPNCQKKPEITENCRRKVKDLVKVMMCTWSEEVRKWLQINL